jgi:hypothetical protein
MKYLILPAIVLALAGPSHAGVATIFVIDTGKYWTVKDGVLSCDA